MAGRPRTRGKRHALTNSLPSTSAPEAQAAAQLVRNASPDVRLQILTAVLTELGFDEKVIQMLLRQIGVSGGIADDLEAMTYEQLSEELGRKQTLILGLMDEATLARASPQQLAVAFGIISDKKLLFEGRPTQIISNEERRALDELLPELIAECHRRGIAIPKPPPQIEGTWRHAADPDHRPESEGPAR